MKIYFQHVLDQRKDFYKKTIDYILVTIVNLPALLPLVPHLLFDFLLLPDDVDVPVFPIRLSQLDRPAAHVLPVQLLHRSSEIGGIFEADETEALRLVALLVSDDFGSDEGGVSAEGSDQDLVGHVVAQVAAKNPVVVRVPLFQRLVFPNLNKLKLRLLSTLVRLKIWLVFLSESSIILGFPQMFY